VDDDVLLDEEEVNQYALSSDSSVKSPDPVRNNFLLDANTIFVSIVYVPGEIFFVTKRYLHPDSFTLPTNLSSVKNSSLLPSGAFHENLNPSYFRGKKFWVNSRLFSDFSGLS